MPQDFTGEHTKGIIKGSPEGFSGEGFSGRFDLPELMKIFPDTADTMLVDHYIADSENRSVRLFRAYRPVPAHFHRQCDEVLYVLSGRGIFWIDRAEHAQAFRVGQLIIFPRMAIHAIGRVDEGPAVFLAIDTPRRDPEDVVFVNPADGTPAEFIKKT